MTVNKLTNPPSQKGVIDKVNEIIDNLGTGGVSTLAELSDVSLSSQTSGQVLGYNGSVWANTTLATTIFREWS